MPSIIKSDIKKKKKTLSKKPVKGTIKKRAKKHVNKPVKKPTKKFVETQKLMIGDYRGYSQKDFINNLYRQPNISRFGTVVNKLYTPLYISPGALSTLNDAPMDNKPFNQTTDAWDYSEWTENDPELSILKYDKTNKTQQSLIPRRERAPPIPFEERVSTEDKSFAENDPTVIPGDFEELTKEEIIMTKLEGIPFKKIEQYVMELPIQGITEKELKKELRGKGALGRGKKLIVDYLLSQDESLRDDLIEQLDDLRRDWTEDTQPKQTAIDIKYAKALKKYHDEIDEQKKKSFEKEKKSFEKKWKKLDEKAKKHAKQRKELNDYFNSNLDIKELRETLSSVNDDDILDTINRSIDGELIPSLKILLLSPEYASILYNHLKNKRELRGRSTTPKSEAKRRVKSARGRSTTPKSEAKRRVKSARSESAVPNKRELRGRSTTPKSEAKRRVRSARSESAVPNRKQTRSGSAVPKSKPKTTGSERETEITVPESKPKTTGSERETESTVPKTRTVGNLLKPQSLSGGIPVPKSKRKVVKRKVVNV